MPTLRPLTPCLWFDKEAEAAANFYVSVFPDSRIGKVSRYGEGFEHVGRKAGDVMVAEFTLCGQNFVALNDGPQFKFSEAISFQIPCQDQREIDHYWEKLTADGGAEGPCGWLKDRFGLSWQVFPEVLPRMMSDPDPKTVRRVTDAFMQMTKFDLAALERAYAG